MWVTDLYPDGDLVVCDEIVTIKDKQVISSVTPNQVDHFKRSARWSWVESVTPIKKAPKKKPTKRGAKKKA